MGSDLANGMPVYGMVALNRQHVYYMNCNIVRWWGREHVELAPGQGRPDLETTACIFRLQDNRLRNS